MQIEANFTLVVLLTMVLPSLIIALDYLLTTSRHQDNPALPAQPRKPNPRR